MSSQSGHTLRNVDAILGLPRPSAKPSSLRRPRPPPPAKYINKERALAIARKYNIQQIGKVTLRAGRGAPDDPPAITARSEKVLTRRILLEREKGLETARNAKDSAVGKCILGRNDYETRRLGAEFEKLSDDSDKRSYRLLRKKSVFVHQRGLTMTQGGIVFDPNSDTKAAHHDHHRQSLESVTSKPLPAISSKPEEEAAHRGMARGKSPSYMRPLSCDRTKSTDSQVAEAERFLSSPAMRRYARTTPAEDSTAFALTAVAGVNASELATGDPPSQPSKRLTPTKASANRKTSSGLPEIAEHTPVEDGAINPDQEGTTHFKNAENFPITQISQSDEQREVTGGHHSSETTRKHSSTSSIVRTRSRSKHEKDDHQADPEEVANRGRSSALKSRRRSRRKSVASSFNFRTGRKHRRGRPAAVPTHQSPTKRFNTAAPSEDPRFTELTSRLVPDSAGAFDLYRDMGRLSVLERLGRPSPGVRKESADVGRVRQRDRNASNAVP